MPTKRPGQTPHSQQGTCARPLTFAGEPRLAGLQPTHLSPATSANSPGIFSHSLLKSKLNRYTNQMVLPTKQQQCGKRRDKSMVSWLNIQTQTFAKYLFCFPVIIKTRTPNTHTELNIRQKGKKE